MHSHVRAPGEPCARYAADTRGRVLERSAGPDGVPEHFTCNDTKLATQTDVRRPCRTRASKRKTEHRPSEAVHVELVAALGELTASLAHELSQPLSGVMSNAQAALHFLAGNEPNIEEARATLADIVDDNRRARELIRRMRTMLGCTEAALARLNLNDIVLETARLATGDAAVRGAVLIAQLDPQLQDCTGIRVQLQQAVLNLVAALLDGADAPAGAPPRERTVTVYTRRVDAGAVELGVTRVGSGTPDTASAQLPAPASTTSGDRLALCISMVRCIATAHGGRLWVERTPGDRTAVGVQLPALRAGSG